MLQTLRRLVSFGDWSRNHPNEPPPGGDLDATFDAIFNALSDLEEKLLQIRRDDGTLRAGSITEDALDPKIVGKITTLALESVVAQLERIETARNEAVSAKILVDETLREIDAAAGRALVAAERVDSAKDRAILKANAALATAQQLLAAAEAVQKALPAPQDYEGEAQAWANASMLWAEHMPDVLPRNSLVWQDISGDHWSARWWANRADNAFGRLTDLYLGAHVDPPLTNLEGGPIQVGSIYYDIDAGVPYIWNGTSWAPFWQPQRAITFTLHYLATAGQTAFDVSANDINGASHIMASGESVSPYVNGIRLAPQLGGPVGDYTVAGNVVTFLRALRAGDIVAVDILADPAKFAPGVVTAYALKDIDLDPVSGNPGYQDGVRTTFVLSTRMAGGPTVNIAKAEELIVSLDGVIQDPGIMFTATTNSVTFAVAPAADAQVFMVWHKAGPG